MTPNERIEKYFLARLLYWRDALDTLDAQAVAQLIKVLESTKADVLAKLVADADGLARITDWNRDRLIQVNAWLTEATTAAQATTLAAITESSVTAAVASLATYNAMLSFEGRAAAVQTVGMTAEQIRTWFQRTPLQNGTVLSDWVSKAFENGVNDSVITAIQRGGLEGKGTAAMVKDVLQTALDDGFAITQREAITLTRTYTQTANVQAMEAVIQANSDIIKGYKRVETLDASTCRMCALADGSEYGLNEKRPQLPAHPNCVIAETPIYAPDKIAAFVSTYCGPVFEVVFSSGARVTTTANHMFLTPDGFVSAKRLRKGTNVFYRPGNIVVDGLSKPNNNGNPSRIDEVIEAFSKTIGVTSLRVPASTVHLHGDAEFGNGYVDVIAPDSLLRGDYKTFFDKFIGDEFFSKAFNPSFSLSPKRHFPSEFIRLWLSLDCHVSGLSIFEVFSGRPFGHHQAVGFKAAPALDSIFDEQVLNDSALNAIVPREFALMGSRRIFTNDLIRREAASNLSHLQAHVSSPSKDNIDRHVVCSGNLRKALSGFMPLSQVVQINCYDFSGHVYDLQTVSSLYQINGIVTSNCRGIYTPVTKSWRDFGIDMDDLEETTRPWVMREPGAIGTGGRKILEYGQTTENFSGWWDSLSATQKAKTSIGPVRGKLLESGAVKWDDLWDKASGLPYTLKELGYNDAGERL